MCDTRYRSEHYVSRALPEVECDLRRILRVQWKEFIHYLDEVGDVNQVSLIRPVHLVGGGRRWARMDGAA